MRVTVVVVFPRLSSLSHSLSLSPSTLILAGRIRFSRPCIRRFLHAGRETADDRKSLLRRRLVSAAVSSTCGHALRRPCVKAATRTTWPDGWERYDGTGAARNFLDNIGRSGRATGANADAYVSGGATRIHAVGACPSRSCPSSRAAPRSPSSWPLLFAPSLFRPRSRHRPVPPRAISRTNAIY